MSLFPNQSPRRYVVTVKLPNTSDSHVERITAFDVGEAMLQTSLRMTAQGIVGGVIQDIAPDMEAIVAEQKTRDADRAVDAICEAVRRNSPLGSALKRALK